MSLSAGFRLGPYEILSALGAGGMGEVYRARDTKLARDVAIKILPGAVANDPERIARFECEAKMLAALNHPHIAHIHGFEDSTGAPALVMELVEGPTLADLIDKGPLPVDEALAIARQIAEALEAAHEQGIIHRDLKPANIKVREDGTVKVLDFGLAKALEPAAAKSSANATQSPTMTTPAMTASGVILGTAAYMSPEQAKGRAADKRSDMWAFGCVLYELLTGGRAFEGEDVGDTLANVLKTEPDWSALPAGTPTAVRRLLRRCLTKDRARRLSDAAVARLEIDEAPVDVGAIDHVPANATGHLERIGWGAAVIVSAAAVVFATMRWTAGPTVPAPVVRFRVTLPEGPNYNTPPVQLLDLSAAGESIAYATPGRLMIHTLNDDHTRSILDTDVLTSTPTFSPNGRWVAFFQTAGLGLVTLKKVAVTGGAAVTLAERLPPPLGANWSDTYIVFGTRKNGVLRVPENGGAPETVVTPGDREVMQSPQLLPGGEAILLTVAQSALASGKLPSGGIPVADWDRADIVVQILNTGQRTTLIRGATDGRFVPSGHLVFARGGILLAAPFDVRHPTVVGGPVPMVEGVRRATTTGSALYALSKDGSLVYVRGPAKGNYTAETLAWTTPTGAVERLDVPAGTYETPRIAPDGRHAAVTYTDVNGPNVWIVDLSGTQGMRRLTDGGHNQYPVWSPAGDRIAFQSDREGDLGIYAQQADGAGTARRLTRAARGVAQVPESWAADGRHLLFSATEGTAVTLWTLTMENGKTEPFGNVRSTQPTNAVFSPDGRWVAYGSSESGTAAVYVQPFPPTGAKYQVSRGDIGHHALWSGDGKRLLYIPLPGRLVFVTVMTQSGFTFSAPTPVPRAFTIGNVQTDPRNHDIARDGKLLGIVPAGQEAGPSTQQIEVVLNWTEELKQRVATK